MRVNLTRSLPAARPFTTMKHRLPQPSLASIRSMGPPYSTPAVMSNAATGGRRLQNVSTTQVDTGGTAGFPRASDPARSPREDKPKGAEGHATSTLMRSAPFGFSSLGTGVQIPSSRSQLVHLPFCVCGACAVIATMTACSRRRSQVRQDPLCRQKPAPDYLVYLGKDLDAPALPELFAAYDKE